MYVSMYVYVPGGALRPKRCVIEAPNSPRAAFFSFATFFSCWCFRLPALHSSEPPPFLPPLLMARLPALLLGITSYVLTIKLAYGTGELVDMGVSDHQTVHQNARNLSARIAISSVAETSVTFQSEKDKDASGGLLRGRPPLCLPDQQTEY